MPGALPVRYLETTPTLRVPRPKARDPNAWLPRSSASVTGVVAGPAGFVVGGFDARLHVTQLCSLLAPASLGCDFVAGLDR